MFTRRGTVPWPQLIIKGQEGSTATTSSETGRAGTPGRISFYSAGPREARFLEWDEQRAHLSQWLSPQERGQSKLTQQPCVLLAKLPAPSNGHHR